MNIEKLLTLSLMLVMTHCASSHHDTSSDNLDVMSKSNYGGKGVVIDSARDRANDKQNAVPADALTNWQAFFKPRPSPDERKMLETSLSHWVDENNFDELLKIGKAEVTLGRLGNAEVSFRKALRLKEDHPEALLELIVILLRRRNWNDAFDLLTRIRDKINIGSDIDEKFVFRYRFVLATAYLGRGEADKGRKILSDLIALDKSFTPAYVVLAKNYISEGKDSVAEFIAKRGLDRCREHGALLNILGVVAMRSRRTETARQYFEQALDVSPNLVEARINRASISLESLELSAAEADLVAALEMEPFQIDALITYGIVQKKLGNLASASAALTKAVDLAPEHAYARFNLAVLYADDLKKPNEAIRLFTEVIQTSTASIDLKRLAKSYLDGLKQGLAE